MSDVASAVAGTVADLFGGTPAAAEPVEAPNSPDAAAPVEAHDAAPAIDLPDLDSSLPDDLAEFLDEPEFDDEPTAQLEEDEFVDPEELARQNAKLRKKLEWTEAQKAKVEMAKWRQEAEKFFPYAHLDSIAATSRRGFLREARAQHEANKSLIAPHVEALKAKEAALRAEIEQKVKAELAEAWGKPNLGGGPSGAPVEAAAASDELDRARNSRNLAAVAKALMVNNRL